MGGPAGLFSYGGLMAGGQDILPAPEVFWLHVVSDVVIAAACFSITAALVYFLRKRRDVVYAWLLYVFAGFILALGLTRAFSIVTIWEPVYGLDGVVKVGTAILSLGMALIFWILALRMLRTPSWRQLGAANQRLQAEVAARGAAERQVSEQNEALKQSNRVLEDTVRQLEQSEEQFRGAFEIAPHGMALVSTDGRWLEVNSALCAMLGYDEQALLATDFQSITHPEDLSADLELVEQVLSGEIPNYHMQKRYVRKDGSIVWGLLSVSLVRDVEGNPVHFVSQVQDMTEQKKAEEILLNAQRMESIGQLTGGVAHDFNNMLMALRLNIELLRDAVAGDPESLETADLALGAVDRGAELTRRLLAFARRQPLRPEKVNLNLLMGDIIALMRRTLGEDIEIDTALSPFIGFCEIDRVQFENALINLALNARDAMPGGGQLTIETESKYLDDDYVGSVDELKAGDYVLVSVTDTGFGMSRDVVAKAVEPFFTTKPVGEGTGLGLSMVYGFVKQSGGHLSIYSEPGRGTVVKIFLPVSAGAHSVVVAEHEPVEEASGNERILVVEDEAPVRVSIRNVLKNMGYEVETAADGPEALALLAQGAFAPDLLIVDIVLPHGMNGRDVADAVKELVPACRVMFMSGYSRNVLGRQNEIQPDLVLLSKPFSRAELATTVRDILDPLAAEVG